MTERVAAYLSTNLIYARVKMNYAKYQEIDHAVFDGKNPNGLIERIEFRINKKVLDTFYQEDIKKNPQDYMEVRKRKKEE